jgi:ribosomal RNA-processing protein 9
MPGPPGIGSVNRTRVLRPMRKKPTNFKYVRGLQNVAGSTEKQGHSGSILTVAVSPSGKFVATGGSDRKLIIWNADTLTPIKTFTHHRDTVSGLSFTRHIPKNSSGEQLFSGSFDRTIKTWSLSSAGHAYVETLFGHQDNVISVASMSIDQCVSVGARDRTARLWKVIDETQLVFRGGSKNAEYQDNNLDCVAVLPPTHFITGSDAGSLSLWSIHKKKPLYTIPLAHGLDPLPPLKELSAEVDRKIAAKNSHFLRRTPRWITALATVPGTDIVLSGSWDGWIRAWRISVDKKVIYPLGPVGGGGLSTPTSPTSTSPSLQLQQTLATNGTFDPTSEEPATMAEKSRDSEPLLKGVVNDIAVYERHSETSKLGHSGLGPSPSSRRSKSSNPKAKDGEGPRSDTPGLCIVAALGKEHRLGRWKCFANSSYGGPSSKGRNGAVVFEVSFFPFSPSAGDDDATKATDVTNHEHGHGQGNVVNN